MKMEKKLIIVTLILLSLFMISTVSAASNTTETSVNSDVSNDEKVSHNVADKKTDTINEKKSVSTKDDKLSNKPDNEILKDDEKTFNELRQNITDAGEGDTTITLQHDYVQDGYAEIVIDPNQKITIHGNGHTLDAKGKSRIFYVVGELILENLKIINGYSESTGGAIETCPDSNMTIINCTFLNNTAEIYGGAIDINEYNIVTITNSQFINNTVINGGNHGGAIYISSNNQVNLINNLFKKNYDSSGCAIDGSSSYSISGVNNVFIDNKPGVSTDIGAKTVPEGSFSELYAMLTTGTTGPKTLTIDYTYNKTEGSSDYEFIGGIPINTTVHIIGNGYTIDGNHSARIFKVTNGGNLTLENLTLTKGKGQEETIDGYTYNVGGAIYAYNSNINITQTLLQNNQATHYGGAIYAYNSNINITQTLLQNNQATYGSGGAIDAGNSNINITQSILQNNTAYSGGAIYTSNSQINITQTLLQNNQATYYGGAIDAGNSNINITQTLLQNNKAGDDGGAIYVSRGSVLNVDYSLFQENTALGNGQAIYATSSNTKVVGEYNAFANNDYTKVPGASIDLTDSVNCRIDSFTSLYYQIMNSPTPIINLTRNYQYYSTSTGGYGNDSNYITGIPITTTVHINGNGHTISGSETARIFRVTDGGNLTLENLKLINGQGQTETTNYGDENVGGAIYANNAKIILINTTFNQNTATWGGAIFAGNGATVNINNITFTNNTATEYGGAIYAETSATVNINNTTFKQNTATWGGAIYACLYTTVNINNTQFNQNNATKWGGAIELHMGVTVNINNTTFTQNNASIEGGAISAKYYATVNINNTQFNQNNALDGGAIHANGVTVNINNTQFNQNTAKSYGGAINAETSNAETSATVNINNTQFNQNTANYGGAIRVYEGDVTVVNCNFTENQAKYDGSAIRITLYGDFTIINSKLTDNNITINNYKINTDCVIDLLTNKFNVDIPDFVYEGLSVLINITGADPIFDGNITVDIKNINNDQTQDQVNVTIKNGEGTKTIDLPIGTYTATFNNLLNGNNLLTKEFMVIGNNSFVALNKNIIDTENTLTITHNYTYDPLTDSEFIGGIPINTTVHIIGNGYTIDGNHSARIFNVKSNGNLTLENLNLINGYNEGYGGAIYTSTGSILTVNNCNFTNNTADKAGAIYAYFNKVTINKSQFTYNTAKCYSGAIYGGNAINCTFSYNTANGNHNGGAMYNGNATNCTFSYNTATDAGGAMFGGTAINCTFSYNTAPYGGAICSSNAINCTFSYNTATGGGAICVITSDILNITNCIFDHNTAGAGGAIEGLGVNVTNCTFINNIATRYGGAMCLGTATNCIFTNNTAKTGGGLNEGTAINCTFEHNVADVGSAMNKGVAIFCIFDEDNTCTDDTTFPVLDASDFTTTYQSGEKLIFNVTCQGEEYTDIPTNITVKKDPDSPGDSYTALTGKDNGWTIPNTLTPGTYTVILSYDKYPEIKAKTVTLTIKYTSNINITTDTVIAHQENTATITLTNSTSAPIGNQYINITVTDEYGNTLFNGTKTTTSIGAVSISYTPITNGTININVLFEGSSTYAGASKNKTVSVNNISTSLTLNVEDTTVGATKNITVTIYDANNKTVNGTIILSFDDGTDDMEIILDGENTTFQKEYTNTQTGKTVNITAKYIPSINSAYNPSNDTKKFNVKYITHFTITVSNSTTDKPINITVHEDNGFTGEITVVTYGKIYFITLQDGEGTRNNITINKTGAYTADLTYPGNETYTPADTFTKFTIKYPTRFTIENINDITEGDSINLIINEANNYTGPVTVTIGSENYTVTLTDGSGKTSITNLNHGTYTATINFPGNDEYENTTANSNTFKVNNKPTPSPEPTINPSKKTVYKVKMYLTLKKVKKISKKTKKLYLKVIVKRNGKKLLTKKITIKVKRNKVKAKKSNKNKAKSKKLSKVQGFKFTVKINGKTYTKKTNKKGKITYTINNLYNKGTYKAKISYKSKYYKKNGKNIKFKIKA